jgi:hypothetical protein
MGTTVVSPASSLARSRESTSSLRELLLQRSGWQAARSNGDLGWRSSAVQTWLLEARRLALCPSVCPSVGVELSCARWWS